MTDLTAAKSTIESLMVDECLITFDPDGSHDDVLDTNTGRLVRPSNDANTIYSGKCSVYPESALTTMRTTEGGGEHAMLRYIVAIPADAPVPPVGSAVYVTAAQDPGLQDEVLRVAGVIGRTRVVVRKLRCELRERITDRP